MVTKELPGSHLSGVRKSVQPQLEKELDEKGLVLGAPVFIRIFKESKQLEVWMKKRDQKVFSIFKTYKISNYGSGSLGPKLKEGDGQAPTGFYSVSKKQLKPDSDYHLAFNLGFPNAYDRKNGRTGSFLMVHGSTASIGCYAMTDPLIEEIYLLVEAALKRDQMNVPVHAFPFRMTEERLERAEVDEKENAWLPEWLNLKSGYDAFERTRKVPDVSVSDEGSYVFSKSSSAEREE